MSVIVMSAGFVIDEQAFASEALAMQFADEQQDLGFKVRVAVTETVAA